MHIEPQVIDDLKTERPDITPPLPQVARAVPLLFYVVLVAAIALCAMFFLQLNEAQRLRDLSLEAERDSRAQMTATRNERRGLEAKAKRASDISNWTETVRTLQPVIVELARTADGDATISEIVLNRRSDQPNQLLFGIKLNGASVNQLDRMIAQFTDRGYRTFSPEQRLSRGQIDYQATLLWQPPARMDDDAHGDQEVSPQ